MDSPAQLQNVHADLAAEQLLLGHLISSRGTGMLALAFLGPQHFVTPVNGLIFRTIERFVAKSTAVTLASLRAHFERTGELADAGGPAYHSQLYAARDEKGRSAADCARAIHDCWIRRQFLDAREAR